MFRVKWAIVVLLILMVPFAAAGACLAHAVAVAPPTLAACFKAQSPDAGPTVERGRSLAPRVPATASRSVAVGSGVLFHAFPGSVSSAGDVLHGRLRI